MTIRHNFVSGQSVRLANGSRFTLAAPGDYKITRLLPERAGELQYRVRSDKEAYERVVGENEIEAQTGQGAFKTNPPNDWLG
jgi:hypothetical protein